MIESTGFPKKKEGTSCHMHSVELTMKHALGKVKRKKRNVIVDSFDEAGELRQKVLTIIQTVFNKKKKHLWIEYSKFAEDKYGENRTELMHRMKQKFLEPT
jgi:hypothetical protein